MKPSLKILFSGIILGIILIFLFLFFSSFKKEKQTNDNLQKYGCMWLNERTKNDSLEQIILNKNIEISLLKQKNHILLHKLFP